MTIERYVLPSGRIATLYTSQPAEAVEESRRTLIEGFGAVPENESARGAVAAAVAGENTPTLNQENEVNEIQPTTTPEHAATDVAAALALIDDGSPYITLEPGDALYQDVEPSFRKPAAWLGCDIEDARGWIHMVHPIDQDGNKVDLPGGDWYRQTIAALDTKLVQHWKRTANAAIRLGDLLVISLGEYTPMGPVDENGDVELVTLAEMRRRSDAEADAWEAAHADAIRAAMPAEATSFCVWDFSAFSDVQGVMYERDFGPVTISWPAEGSNGTVRVTGGPEVMVRVGNQSDVVDGVDELRKLASALMAAIPVVETATEVD